MQGPYNNNMHTIQLYLFYGNAASKFTSLNLSIKGTHYVTKHQTTQICHGCLKTSCASQFIVFSSTIIAGDVGKYVLLDSNNNKTVHKSFIMNLHLPHQ